MIEDSADSASLGHLGDLGILESLVWTPNPDLRPSGGQSEVEEKFGRQPPQSSFDDHPG